mmetsp:Transcript_43881/g.133651  ORF Transcript_43881/g.133651 Transcript_43881/m.133651 type:complete len:230 (-) Transcript_43881:296-985(-)
MYFSTFRFIDEFQWFLMALSVRPGRCFAISAHLFPRDSWFSIMIRSSSSIHGFLLMSGLRWLCHLSRHCFPIRPGSSAAIWLHLLAPWAVTSSTTFLSSSSVQGPFSAPAFSPPRIPLSLLYRRMHSALFRFFPTISATFDHAMSLIRSLADLLLLSSSSTGYSSDTIFFSFSSSSSVHLGGREDSMGTGPSPFFRLSFFKAAADPPHFFSDASARPLPSTADAGSGRH